MSTNMMKNKQWFDENVTDVDFITAHEDLTPRGPIHVPISSAEILLASGPAFSAATMRCAAPWSTRKCCPNAFLALTSTLLRIYLILNHLLYMPAVKTGQAFGVTI